MAEQHPHQPVSPYLTVNDGKAAIDFYKRAFGAIEVGVMEAEDKKRIMHAALSINGGIVMLSDEFPEYANMEGTKAPKALGGTAVTIHLHVTEVDSAFKRAVDAGAQVVMPLENMFWGDRYGKLRDPFGHVWSMGAPIAK